MKTHLEPKKFEVPDYVTAQFYDDVLRMSLGGISSVIAATFTHPIDTYRVKM